MNTPAAAIIPAAGSGTRMKASCPKQYLLLDKKPILIHTVAAFHSSPDIDCIIVVVPTDRVNSTRELLQHWQLDKKTSVIPGGLRRQDSVKAGLDFLSHDIGTVLVHDGARPLVSNELIARCLEEASLHGAAIAAIPVKDTLKRADLHGNISGTVDRAHLWQAQTPQAANAKLLRRAFAAADGRDVTDEASLLEMAGIPVRLVPGAETNIKITQPEDLIIAEKILMEHAMGDCRIGHGFDAHRLVEKRDLVLGGVRIQHQLGLAGHSDADVVTHALCDALLGALGKGDIGNHFPDSSAQFKDISSLLLLQKVISLMQQEGYGIGNADLTIICQEPKLAPHIPAMKKVLAESCLSSTASLNIKATTTEKMGYTGRGEGISCHAVVCLIKARKEYKKDAG